MGYHFRPDGDADKWINRGVIILWALLPQLLLTLAAWGVTRGIVGLGSQFGQLEGGVVRPGKVLLLIGNIIALPQIILCFAILDIFSYNSYRIHLLPLWVFILIIMGGGGIILGVFFIRTLLRVWSVSKE